jgi:cysteine-rich repeat protein
MDSLARAVCLSAPLIGALALLALSPLAAQAQICGNTVVELGEQCDDGNTVNGDCCSSTCQFEPLGSSCADADVCNGAEVCNGAGACQAGTPLVCDDADLCSQDSCDAIAGCINDFVPASSCNESMDKAMLRLVANDALPGRNALSFRWHRGTSDIADFGDPVGGTDYAVCVYDADGLVTSSAIPGAAVCGQNGCWSDVAFNGDAGVRYRDVSLANDGAKSVMGRSGQGTAMLRVAARGENLPLTEFGPAGLVDPVTVDVVTSDVTCWGVTFGPDEIGRNGATQFRALYTAGAVRE